MIDTFAFDQKIPLSQNLKDLKALNTVEFMAKTVRLHDLRSYYIFFSLLSLLYHENIFNQESLSSFSNERLFAPEW
jgi:hypothetical protein